MARGEAVVVAVECQGLPVGSSAPDQLVGSAATNQQFQQPDIGGGKGETEESDGKGRAG